MRQMLALRRPSTTEVRPRRLRRAGATSLLTLTMLTSAACSTSQPSEDRAHEPPTSTAPAPTSPTPVTVPTPPGPHSWNLGHAGTLPRWSRPERVSDRPRFDDPDGPVAVIRIRGRDALAAWVVRAGPNGSRVKVSARSATGAWEPSRALGPAASDHIYQLEAALGPKGSAAVAWDEPSSGYQSSRVMVAYRENGFWMKPRELGAGEVGEVVIDRSGVVTVTWTGQPSTPKVGMSAPPWPGARGGPSTSGTYVVRMREGHWEEPQLVAKNCRAPDAAVNGHGDTAVVCTTDSGVVVSIRRQDSGRWDEPTHIKGIAYPEDAHIAVDDRGRALAMWARSTEEESLARRHLAWARARPDGTWTSALFLEERPHKSVIGTQLGLSMEPRGRAVAAWSTEGFIGNSFRVARFSFQSGWTTPTLLAQFAYEPTPLITRSGSAVVTLNFYDPPAWAFWKPGHAWTTGGRGTRVDLLDSFGQGSSIAEVYESRRRLMARFLLVPASSRGPSR